MSNAHATRVPSRGAPRAAVDDAVDARQARLWTAERVPLTVPLAGLGERSLAYLLDLLILVLAGIAVLFVYNITGDLQRDIGQLSRWGTFLGFVAAFAGAVLYDVLFETFGAGRTPGKRILGLRVLRASGMPPDLFTSVLRNVLRLVDILPVGYGVGIAALFFTGTRRIGDLVADTVVVRERRAGLSALAQARALLATRSPPSSSQPSPSLSTPWSDADVLLALSIVERGAALDAKSADALAVRAWNKLDASAGAQIGAGDKLAALAARVVAHARLPSGVITSLVRLEDAQDDLQRALDRFTEVGRSTSDDDAYALDLAIRRAGSALMRATRSGVPSRHLEALSLALLATGRLREPPRSGWKSAQQFFTHDVPKSVWQERTQIARAAAVLVTGLVVGFATGFASRDVARVVMSDAVVRLVEQGATWTNDIEKNGIYGQAAFDIIINNVGVGLRAFVFGVFGALVTLLILFWNGIALGATFGYAVQLHTAGTLGTFVLAHAPVEFTMIAVSGAAGMCLARGLLAPGHRTRLEALRHEGAQGIRLVAAAVAGFVVIGTVEGFISPGSYFPWQVNLTVGVSLWLVFGWWVKSFGQERVEPTRASSTSR